MEKLSYILFEDETTEGIFMIGFNKYNDPGFIDDGFGWEEDEEDDFFEEILLHLEQYIYLDESYRFGYEVRNLNGLEDKLREMGITKQEPGWLE